MENIINLIDKKVNEHKKELETVGDFKTKLREKIAEATKSLTSKSPKIGDYAQEILTIDKKVNFHLACIKCLEELRKEINET